MEVKTILEQLGFSEVEADIYLAALVLETPGATEIARRTNQQRTLVFFHLKKLVERGFMKESRSGRLVRFIPLPPNELASRFDAIVANLQSAVPELSKLQKASDETPIIEVRESRAGYKKIYEELSSLPENDFFYVIQGRESLDAELRLLSQEDWSRWFERINTRHIGTSAIFTEESLAVAKERLSPENLAQHKKRLWQISTVPENRLPLQQLVFIYRNKVSFLFPKSELVVAIEHKKIADVFRALFHAIALSGKHIDNPWE